MDGRRVIAGGAAAALVAVATVAWVLLSPGWAVRALDMAAGQQLGRQFSAKGGAHLEFSPLAIRIDEPALTGPAGSGDSLAKAQSLIIPVTLGQLITRAPSLTSMSLRDAEFALLIDERGEASWDFPGAQPGQPLNLTLEQASFRYFDARNSQALALSNVDGLMRFAADGGVTFSGSAVLNSRVAQIELEIKSLPRSSQDGSPIELAIESDAASATFSGRLATGKVLSLVGPVSLTSREPATVARWAGIPVDEDMRLPGPLTIDGGLDSAGRAYAIRSASVTLGQFRGAGDIVADLRDTRPKLQADLQAETVWLDALVPSSGAEPGFWGRAPLHASLLRSFDAEISILSRAFAYRGLTGGATRLAATVKDGKLDASGATQLDGGATASFTAAADAMVLPPAGSLTLRADTTALETLITALTGITALSGTGTLSAELKASGQTQEELMGTLAGTASIALTDGRLAGLDLGGLFPAVSQNILEGWGAAPGGTPLTSLTANVTVADGVATISSAEAVTPQAQLSLSGTVDMLRRALDIKASFMPPQAAPLPVPVIVSGKWAAPRIYPDIPDILNNPAGGFARLRSGESPPGN